ncbi:MAG: ABC transporter permease [Anaerolineae bacterium]|nr:ABC transporter permease [Anaerolineae bacterium]
MTTADPISLSEQKKTIQFTRRELILDRLILARDFLKRLWRSPSARIGGIVVLITVGISVGVPLFNDYDALRDRDLPSRYAEPDCVVKVIQSYINDYEEKTTFSNMTCDHPFGADKNGRDIMRRVGHGMSVSLWAGVVAVVFSLSIGGTVGLLAGFVGGWVDSIFMRLMDVILAFPSLLLAVALVTVAGANLQNGMIAVGITQIPVFARLARSMSISIRNQEYVLAARSIGTRQGGILFNHVLPNSLAPLIVQSTLGLGTAVIETAALGFLGLGQQPPYPELGKMLADSQQSLLSGKWWVMVFPGAAIIMIVLGFNLLGDGLRDVLDPRLKK